MSHPVTKVVRTKTGHQLKPRIVVEICRRKMNILHIGKRRLADINPKTLLGQTERRIRSRMV
jgi:hypothetical protein